MSRYWQKTLQDTVGKAATGLSDGAARLKQGWADPRTGAQASPEPSSQSSSPRPSHASPEKDKPQYLRLPLESARKLRWYDREDLSQLVETHLRDKRQLQATVAALRQVVQDAGVPEAGLEEDVRERIEESERQAAFDEGVASVLLAALQPELARLQERAAAQAAEIAALKERRPSSGGAGPVVLQIRVQGGEPPAPAPPLLPVSGSIRLSGGEARAPQEAAGASPAGRDAGDAGPGEEAGAMAPLLGKLQRLEEERRESWEEIGRLGDLVRSHEAGGREAREALARLQAELDAARAAAAAAGETAEARLQELKGRVAASQSQHAEMLRRAQDICIEAEDRAAAQEKRAGRGEARAGRAEAEAREAGSEAKRLAAELKAADRERGRLEARAAAAEAQLAEARQRGDAARGGALAAGQASEEREAGLRRRLERLESEASQLRRSASRADAQAEGVEARLAAAEAGCAQLQEQLAAAEAAAADRDELQARAQALQERLEEGQAVRAQLANYKQIAKELEADRARVEEEVVATVRIATSLEARLQASHAARAAAEAAVAAAEQRAAEAERRVEREVARRLELAGADEAQWPAAAREGLARHARKLEAMHAVLGGLQGELDAEQHALAAERAAKQALQAKLAAAEEGLERLEREAHTTITRLERKASAARAEAAEWQREVEAAEGEIARLSSAQRSRPPLPGFQRASSAGSHASTPRRGGGALPGVPDPAEAANGGRSGPVDLLYLKNVLLKFVVAATDGRTEQCQVLLPAVATLLHATPAEFKALKSAVSQQAGWWAKAPA